MSRALFPGAMGPEGFISCFDHLLEAPKLRRRLILKGGPGVGKSTFIRQLHAALDSEDAPSTLYFCSGDPDSLDAAALPAQGLVVLDGTAPHTTDAVLPGARDSLINLGDCLDEAALRQKRGAIEACMQAHRACTRRARVCLSGASLWMRGNAALIAEAMQERRVERMTRALIQSVLHGRAAPCVLPAVRPVITDAVTCKGQISFITDSLPERIIRLSGRPGMDFTPLLKRLSRAAQDAGFSVEEHLNPLCPGGLLHVGVPALSTLVTTSPLPEAEQVFDLNTCIPEAALMNAEASLCRGMDAARLHIQYAKDALCEAKALHDELEAFYVPHMDFTRWKTIFEHTLSSLKES